MFKKDSLVKVSLVENKGYSEKEILEWAEIEGTVFNYCPATNTCEIRITKPNKFLSFYRVGHSIRLYSYDVEVVCL